MKTLVFSIVGGGIITLFWYIFKAYKGYLQINLSVSRVDNICVVKTQVENPNEVFPKYIENAFLLICPEANSSIEIGREVAKALKLNSVNIEFSNDFIALKNNKSIYLDRKICFMPLSFYYSENIAVGNEKLTYTCSIDSENLEKGIYSVRFFVFPQRDKLMHRYHISSQDLMVIS